MGEGYFAEILKRYRRDTLEREISHRSGIELLVHPNDAEVRGYPHLIKCYEYKNREIDNMNITHMLSL